MEQVQYHIVKHTLSLLLHLGILQLTWSSNISIKGRSRCLIHSLDMHVQITSFKVLKFILKII